MRLIHTERLQLEEFTDDIPPYAILSHRWGKQEVSFQDILNRNQHAEGYRKVERFCEVANQNGFEYAWIDTCCINKESSAELSEAINSMFRWYESAGRCYAYLYDISSDGDQSDLSTKIRSSEYFKRGWTLQELIAPPDVRLLADDWSEIGSRDSWCSLIHDITNIDESILRGSAQLSGFSIARRMSWAAGRKTTRTEDVAYCLMGIFHVNMPLLYGEGEKAFVRLQEEIMKESADQTLFAWEARETSERLATGLLAQSPADFKNSGDIVPFYFSKKDAAPFSVTNRGIRLHLPFYNNLLVKDILVLECQDTAQSYRTLVGIYLLPSPAGQLQYMRHNSRLNRAIPLGKMRHVKAQTIYVLKTSNGEGGSSLLHEHKPYHYTEPRLRKEIGQSGELPKKLILCFDGGITRYDAKHQSNIEKIHDMLYGTNGSQLCHYQRVNSDRASDFIACMDDGYTWLVDYYNVGDEIFLFGFSHGAYMAQALAKMLQFIGILPESNGRFKAVWEIYQHWNNYALRAEPDEMWEERESYFKMKEFRERFCKPANLIPFLGLFDTTVIRPRFLKEEDEQTPIASEISKSAGTICHAVSIDEYQAALRPILLREELGDGLRMKGIKQVWFPGGHADIGGLVPLEPGEFWSLGHIPLVWMFGCDEHTQVSPLNLTNIMESGILSEQYNAYRVSPESVFSTDQLKDSLHLASIQGHLHNSVGRQHTIKREIAQALLPYAAYRKLPFTKPRDLPLFAKVHASAIRRMTLRSSDYRPANVIMNREPGRNTTLYSAYKKKSLITFTGFGDMIGQCYIVVNKAEARSIAPV
ncbi:uncharacterized protein BDW43DRAFT_307857 [Aspergillus alliaceus]|uniref:uncharacterized protein n=1 Tax=Petromyces alliaceus TaxID=209559 RepID=UPI0012A47C2C|nr:uncharacterized protein BDW43DRAFT_307857 [Aspergillus alliaceus]KAB8236841.1 hypothetical protein BDW43DRAFT_307857 [Aspergillus alliaceus]